MLGGVKAGRVGGARTDSVVISMGMMTEEEFSDKSVINIENFIFIVNKKVIKINYSFVRFK